MGDPVRNGLLESLARPNGNLTGLSMGFAEGLGGKWLELLQETVPRLSVVAGIGNPDNPLSAPRSLACSRPGRKQLLYCAAGEEFNAAHRRGR